MDPIIVTKATSRKRLVGNSVNKNSTGDDNNL